MHLSNPKKYPLLVLIYFVTMQLFVNLNVTWAQQGDSRPSESELAVQTFKVRYLDINEAKEKIKTMLTHNEDMEAYVDVLTLDRFGEEVNFLLVKDTSQKVQEIGHVLEEWEKEVVPVTVNLDFTDVAINQILATLAQTTDLNIIGDAGLSQKISVHLKDIPLDDVFDIILKSTEFTYIIEDKVLRIIRKDEIPLVTKIFELEFTSAERIKKAVTHLITARGTIMVYSKFSKGQNSNILVVTDTLRALYAVEGVIDRLDRKVEQVMIEAKFCEVTLDKDDELGIDWVVQASLTGASGPTTLPFGERGEGLPQQPRTIDETTGSITVGTISYTNFTATLSALNTKTKVNIIASPRIATRDGEEAEIIIGSRIPIPLYERNETTGQIEITGYEDEEVGVLLRVTPFINVDNSVTLQLHPEVSEITGFTGPNNERPIVSTRQMTTVFNVENGKTIVLGGLMKQTLTNTTHQVPLLGNIPLLGNLFKFKDDSEDKTDLLIFMTPYLVDGSEETLEEAARMN
jgi:type IV pilus assembly protein PilQ